MTPVNPLNPPKKSHVFLYVLVVMITLLLVTSAVVLIILIRPGVDNGPSILAIVGFGGSALAGILAFLKADSVGQAVQEVHVMVNSQLAEWRLERDRSAEAALAASRDAAAAALTAANAQIAAAKAAGVSEGMMMASTVTISPPPTPQPDLPR